MRPAAFRAKRHSEPDGSLAWKVTRPQGDTAAMSQEIIDGLRSAYRHFADGDFSAYARLPDDFVLKVAPEMPDAGSYRGAAARDWLAAWVKSFDHLTLEATQFIDGGERIAIEVIQRGWFKGSDTP